MGVLALSYPFSLFTLDIHGWVSAYLSEVSAPLEAHYPSTKEKFGKVNMLISSHYLAGGGGVDRAGLGVVLLLIK